MRFLETVIDLIIAETCQYVEQVGYEDSFLRFPGLRIYAKRATEERIAEARQSEELSAARYQKLLDKLSGGNYDGMLQTVVDLALAATQVPEFAAYLTYYTGNGATIRLACELLGISIPDYAKVKDIWEKLGCVFNIEENPLPACANVEGNQELLSYLTGDDSENPALGKWAEWFFCGEELHPMYVRKELAETGAKALEDGTAVLQIAGQGGRRFLAKQIAKRLNRDLLLLPAGRLWKDERAEKHLAQALHETFLYESAVCIHALREDLWKGLPAVWEEFYAGAVRPFSVAGVPVVLCTDSSIGFSGAEKECLRISLPILSRKEREQVWAGFAERYDLPESPARCALRYRLNASEIAAVLLEWSSRCTAEKQNFSDICYRRLCAGQKEAPGQVIMPQTGISELVAPPKVRRTLEEICCGAAEGYRIYEEWNLDGRYPYGRAMSVLLAGPPGTGKTMTAHVLAHEIGVPLYQVDLSHVMDKYIGETEKHLEQVFDLAEKTNMALFFDEADALFGRRGEVAEGKDRYANAEVAYLLQRIERFDGVVILATNFYHNIDKAFLRRMKYVLKYQLPDETLRRAIWENCLPPELPQEELDVCYLARQFEMSGGMIKNSIQTACVAALYERRPLGMEQVLKAVRMEYEKMERNLSENLWGEYAYLMNENEKREGDLHV